MKVAVHKLVGIGFSLTLLFAAGSLTAQETAPVDAESAEEALPEANEPEAGSSEAAASSSASADAAQGAAADGSDEESTDLDGETYQVRLRDLEQRVDELKEQIRRSHTRLSLLSDTILAGASGGGRAEIQFHNELSGAWHVVEAVFVLDGAVQYKKTDDTGVLAKQTTIPIFSGSVPTGDHTLQVMLKLRGHGFGVFSYLRGVEATVRASHSFTLSDGKVLELKATAWEKGGPTTPVEQQPDVRFNSVIRSLSDMPKAAPAGSTPSGSSDPATKKSGGGASVTTKSENKDGKIGAGTSTGASTEGK